MDAPQPRSRMPRCESCHRGHQKCTFTQQPEAGCDRCISMNKDCRMVDFNASSQSPASLGNGDYQKRTRMPSSSKCSLCRKHHMKCEPAGRVWPTKCDRCEANGYECSPPGDMSNIGVREAKKRKAFEDSGGALKHYAPSPMHTTHTLVPVSEDDIDNLIKSDLPPSAEELSGHHYRHDQFAPPPPPSAMPNGAGGNNTMGTSRPVGTENMVPEKMITDMEEEFQNVLTQQKKAHDEEIRELKRSFETQIADLRARHEKRLDDLLSIMSRMGSSDKA